MTVADLIELLSHCESPSQEVVVRVWASDPDDEPLCSRCAIRDVTEVKGTVVIDVDER